LQEWSQHGVARMCRMLTVLQPGLTSLEGPAKGDVTKHFDKARLYFSLLMYSPEGLQKAASDKPGRFTVAEYTALLQVSICLSQANISIIASSISILSVSQGKACLQRATTHRSLGATCL